VYYTFDEKKNSFEPHSPSRRSVKYDLSDPRIKFADMTGDGLQDLVVVNSSRMIYHPNLGNGQFGEAVQMSTPGLINRARFNPQMLYLADLDGSGPADLIYLESGTINIWFNQSGNSLSKPLAIKRHTSDFQYKYGTIHRSFWAGHDWHADLRPPKA
jgi:hypothetical protein